MLQTLTDRRHASREEKRAYERVRKAEFAYGVKLRKIARNVGDIVNAFPAGSAEAVSKIESMLRKYAEMIRPWASVVASSMLADVSLRDEKLWSEMTKGMSLAMREEIRKAPTGETLRKLQREQIDLITSIPLKAAERVHKLTMEGLSNASRAGAIAKEILRTTHVTESRATLIARTEVGRAATNLAEARALHVGSDGYVWRTAKDADVRPSHRKMEGKLVKWSNPPTLEGMTGHAGTLPNCRCYPEVILPDLE